MRQILTTQERIREHLVAMKQKPGVTGLVGEWEPGIAPLMYQRSIDSEQVKKIPTGIKQLDDCLHGGLHCGGYTVLASNEGTGKTTITIQFARGAVESGHRVWAFSNEDGAGRWKSQFVKMVAGPRWIQTDDEERSTSRVYEDAEEYISAYYADYIAFATPEDLADSSWTGVKSAIERYAKQGFELFILDNLMTLASILRKDPNAGNTTELYDAQSKACADLRTLGKKLNIAIILVQHNKKKQISSSLNRVDDISSQDGAGSQDVSNAAMMYLRWEAYDRDKKREALNKKLGDDLAKRFGVELNQVTTAPPHGKWPDTPAGEAQHRAYSIYQNEHIEDQTDRRLICCKDRLYGMPFFERTLRYDDTTLRYSYGLSGVYDESADSWEVAYECYEIPAIYKELYGADIPEQYRVNRYVKEWIEKQKQEQEEQKRKEEEANRKEEQIKQQPILKYEGLSRKLKELKIIGTPAVVR